MANILNQDEIDSLLNAMEKGELDEAQSGDESGEQEFQLYNFRRPSLITKEQLRNFTNLHEDFAREINAALALMLRANIEFKLVSAEQQQYTEFINSLAKISYAIVFSAEPLPGLAVLELNLSLVFGICDLLMGGQGDVETEMRKPTEIEISVISPMTEKILSTLHNSWNALMGVSLQMTRYETDPEYIQAAPHDAPVVVMAFDVKVGLANGIVNLCYPLPMIQAFIEQVSASEGKLDGYYGKKADEESRTELFNAVLDIPLPVSAVMGHAKIKGTDLLNLSPGDIVLLNNTISDPIVLNIAGKELFLGHPGKIKDNLAVRVDKRIEYQKAKMPVIEVDNKENKQGK